MGLEYFGPKENPMAIVIRSDYAVDGITFFSPSFFSQQIGLMTRPAGYKVLAHKHNFVERHINTTQEVLLIRSGECRINLYDDDNFLEHSVVLTNGDVILLAQGGHEIIMNKECAILEVKQGPYIEGEDKTHFIPAIP